MSAALSAAGAAARVLYRSPIGRSTAASMDTIIPFALAAMFHAAPPERLAVLPAFPGWEETVEERRERYVGIEHDAHAAAFDPAEHSLYAGPSGRVRTELAMLAFAHHESGFARDVDLGPCANVRDKKTGVMRCDGGRSACMMQIQVGAGRTAEGWTAAELFAHRQKCFRAGLHKMASSRCPKNAPEQFWAAYASGSCKVPSQAAAELAAEVKRFSAGPLPLDADVIAADARLAAR